MEFTAKQIAAFIQGRIVGDENATVNTFAKIEEGVPKAISFLANPKYINYIYQTKSTIILVDDQIKLGKEVPKDLTIIWVKNVRDCVAKLLQLYQSSIPEKEGIDSLAFISPKAQIGKDVYIGAFAFIGENAIIGNGSKIYPHTYIGDNVQVGQDCKIYPNVSIYHSCKLGNRVILHSGSVIGADGFGFAPNPQTNSYDKIPQIGVVTIEDDVEVGANTCVDRSTMGSTYIRKGVKLDNLIQIAHNDDIGENTVMSAQVGIAGSTKVGKWCMFGGQCGISGHIKIGNNVKLGAKSGVPSNLRDNQTLIGVFPMKPFHYFKSQALFQKLPELYQQINELQKEVDALKRAKDK